MAFEIDNGYEEVTKIKVIGVGGGGGNAINRMVESLSESALLDGCSGYELLNAANFYCKPRHSTFENIMPQSLMIYQAISGYSKNGKFNFV